MKLFGFGKTPETNLDNIDKLAVIDKDTAEILSKNEGSLKLDDVTSIDDATAEVLFNHKGEISLNGLTSLSKAVLENLSKNKGGLSFNGITSIDDVAAEHLSKHEGYLSLDGLDSLSPLVAEILHKHKGSLSLKGLIARIDGTGVSLSLAAARSLYNFEVYNLKENNLKVNLYVNDNVRLQINIEGYIQEIRDGNFDHVGQLKKIPIGSGVAEIFSEYKKDLALNNLVELSVDDCKSLSTHEGNLYLPSLKFVPDGGEKALAKHKGAIIAIPSVRAVIEDAKKLR